MPELTTLTDEELFYSVGSQRPSGKGLQSLFAAVDLPSLQKQYDEAVAEMKRRDAERGFPYQIPRGDE